MKRLLSGFVAVALMSVTAVYVNAQPAETDATAIWWPGLKTAIEDLSEKVAQLEGSVSTLSGETSTLKVEVNSLKSQTQALTGQINSLAAAINSMSNEVIVSYKLDREPVIGHMKITQSMCADKSLNYDPDAGVVTFDGAALKNTFDWACKSDRAEQICRLYGYDIVGLAIPAKSTVPPAKRGDYVPVMGNTIPCVGIQAM